MVRCTSYLCTLASPHLGLTATTRSVTPPTSHPPRATEGVSLGAVRREQMVAAQGAALLSSFGVRRPLKYPESEARGNQTAHVSATRPAL